MVGVSSTSSLAASFNPVSFHVLPGEENESFTSGLVRVVCVAKFGFRAARSRPISGAKVRLRPERKEWLFSTRTRICGARRDAKNVRQWPRSDTVRAGRELAELLRQWH